MLSINVLVVAIYLSLGAQAAPRPLRARASHATHRSRHIGRSVGLNSFYPESTFKTFGAQGLAVPIPQGTHGGLLEEQTLSFIHSQLNLGANQVRYRSGFSRGPQTFAYVEQIHNGIPCGNTAGNVVWDNGKVVAFGSSFVTPTKIADSTPSVKVEDAIPVAEKVLDGTYNNHPPTLEYLAQDDGTAALAHVFQVSNDRQGTWYEAFVDAHTNELLSVTNFVAHDSYNVVPIVNETLIDGQKLVNDPRDPDASPGWHNDKLLVFPFDSKATSGNNVYAFNLVFPALQTSSGHVFDTSYDDTKEPTVRSNKQAAIVNGFYVANIVHDFTYRYGFTEAAFNFQQDNFRKGGKDWDRVLLSVQDFSGTNNANFATPPDGQPGICRMFIWDLTSPKRDGAMENDIVVHEMTHGVTNRLTGGGSGRCLQTLEAGGMGEGWSDAMADWVTQTSMPIKDFVLGQYVTNNPAGIRSHPYSTNSTVNPLRYSSIANLQEVHQIGEVWANILHNVHAALVEAHGLSRTPRTNPDTSEGNVVFMRLFMDALSMQPCNPTLISARDAWFAADLTRYKEKNKCILWRAFASRGLGVNAKNFMDDTLIPSTCLSM